jgi:hypothetical protein
MVQQDDTPGTIDASRVEVSPDQADAGSDKPHATHVVVWETPPAVERGKRFTVRLGVTCSAKCRPTGWMAEVRDHDGEKLATTTLGDDPWPGTDALYHAEVALEAPDTEGLYTWKAAVLTGDADVTHTDGGVSFRVRVVSTPACLLTVVALDAKSQNPVAGAQVVAHPYRAVTDARGVAQLQVPAGEYRLFVSGKRYIPFRFDGELQTDTTIRAELAPDVELSDADIWS